MRRTAVTGLLAATGAACVLLSLTGQQRPAPPAVGSFGPPAAAPVSALAPVASTSASPSTDAPKSLSPSRPTRLTVPAIGVTSDVRVVGQAADGSIEVPPPGPRYDDAAWYRHSPTPGTVGPAVVIGHVDSASGGPSVFFRLGELRPRDRVSVERADGSTAVFVVDAVRRYPKGRFPTSVVYGNTTGPELRLITCGGPFDRRSGHYKDNIVVFASLSQQTAAAG